MTDSGEKSDELFGDAIRGAIYETIGQEDDEEPFEFLADDPDREGKSPYGKGKKLVALRRARAEVLEGVISLSDFKDRVDDVLVEVSRAVDLLELASVKKTEVTLPKDQADVIAATRNEMIKLEAGIESMLTYGDTQNLGDLDDGLVAVEEAMKALIDIQARAEELSAKGRT